VPHLQTHSLSLGEHKKVVESLERLRKLESLWVAKASKWRCKSGWPKKKHMCKHQKSLGYLGLCCSQWGDNLTAHSNLFTVHTNSQIKLVPGPCYGYGWGCSYNAQWTGTLGLTWAGAKDYYVQFHSAKSTKPFCKSTWKPLLNGACQIQTTVPHLPACLAIRVVQDRANFSEVSPETQWSVPSIFHSIFTIDRSLHISTFNTAGDSTFVFLAEFKLQPVMGRLFLLLVKKY
jgi:hypothetical protein